MELEGIIKARELLAQMGSSLPQLSKAQTEELEPLVLTLTLALTLTSILTLTLTLTRRRPKSSSLL